MTLRGPGKGQPREGSRAWPHCGDSPGILTKSTSLQVGDAGHSLSPCRTQGLESAGPGPPTPLQALTVRGSPARDRRDRNPAPPLGPAGKKSTFCALPTPEAPLGPSHTSPAASWTPPGLTGHLPVTPEGDLPGPLCPPCSPPHRGCLLPSPVGQVGVPWLPAAASRSSPTTSPSEVT